MLTTLMIYDYQDDDDESERARGAQTISLSDRCGRGWVGAEVARCDRPVLPVTRPTRRGVWPPSRIPTEAGVGQEEKVARSRSPGRTEHFSLVSRCDGRALLFRGWAQM